MKTVRIFYYLFFLIFIFTSKQESMPFNQLGVTDNSNPDSTKEKPTQYRRGIELQEGFQSYNEKYAGKNLNEIKRSLFPLRGGTGVWTELNPKVPRVDYLGIHFINKDTCWAVGDLGALIKTTDGGNSWTISETNTTTPILKVRSYNGQIVIASGFDGLILRSTDSGETFEQAASGVTGDLWGLQMINDNLGWACGNSNSLVKTTDGGQTWQKVITAGYTSDYWWIDFLNESYGFIAANGKVLRTTDGGQNWEIIQAGDNQPLFSIDVIGSLHIAAAGYGGTSYRGKNIYSSDGGYTWINGGPLTFEAVNCIQYVNPDTGYLLMTNVSARKTTNRGQEWTTIQGISDNYELQFLENNTGYSAGTGLQINKAVVNLDVWSKLIINDNFTDVYFTSETTGYAAAENRIIYKTINGGESFTTVLNSLTFTDSLTGYAGGGPSRIVKTIDAGNSWYVTNRTGLTDTLGTINKIFFINSTMGWAVNSRGGILKTTDAGENWFAQLNAGVSVVFNSVYFIDSLYGWTANESQWPYKTINGGNTWVQQNNLNIFGTKDIYFVDSLNGFTIKILELYKSTNSGSNWFTQLNSPYVLRSFGWLSDNHGFIVGDGVYETIDSGNTWQEILELRNIGLRKFHAPKNYLGYATGNLGLIYKYLDTTIVPVELISLEGKIENNKIILTWQTASELNNSVFKIEKSYNKENWFNIGFVEGNGTTTGLNYYSFIDNEINSEIQFYRLKQIDYDGSFEFSKVVEVKIEDPVEFSLSQNYPNPFNPVTKIVFNIPEKTFVRIILYDIAGRVIKKIVDEAKEAGNYSVSLNSEGISSGVYFYKMTTGSGYTAVNKLTIIK